MWVCYLASFISFIPCPFFTLPSFSLSTTPRERSPPIHTSNSFHPISPHLSSKPQTKQPYASPSSSSTFTLKKPFNIGASSFPPVFPLTFFHHSKTYCLYSLPHRQDKMFALMLMPRKWQKTIGTLS